MKKIHLCSLIVATSLLSGCGVQDIMEEEALLYMRNIRQKQQEEDFSLPNSLTIDYVHQDRMKKQNSTMHIVLDSEQKYCYFYSQETHVENTITSEMYQGEKQDPEIAPIITFSEQWVYIKEDACIVAKNENHVKSYQEYTGDVLSLWSTYSESMQNQASLFVKGNAYLALSYYQNAPQLFDNLTLSYDDPHVRYATKGSGSLMITFSRDAVKKKNEDQIEKIGQVSYQITFDDYLLKECSREGYYQENNADDMTQMESVMETTKVKKQAKILYPVLEEYQS